MLIHTSAGSGTHLGTGHLKLSMKAFCTGLPGLMKRKATPVRSDQSNMAFDVPSGPLSSTISSGSP